MEINLNRIKAERIAAGISQQQMAKVLGISRGAYWKRENGQTPIGAEELAKIAETIGIDKDNIGIFFKFNVTERQHLVKE
jgi:transcriptional regulator with XRE-family HTH domain